MQTKQCKRCGETKSVSEFFIWKRSSDGFDYHCKVCKRLFNLESYQRYKEKRIKKAKEWVNANKEHAAKYRKQYYQENKPKAKLQSRIRKLAKYGITTEQYTTILEKQKNVCAICKKGSWRNLAVDHCHKTNKVRGLLCHKCNALLGYANDSVVILESAKKYLS